MMRIKTFNAHPKYKIRNRETKELACHVLKKEGHRKVECSIIFIDDRRMKELNGTYRHHWYTTDVLSFSLSEYNSKIEGEVYINVDQARRQARRYNVSIKNEISRLVIHGLLHLIGYEDKTKKERDSMTKLENSYLAGVY
ncbi:MAG: rRNA maturation RNase YbeY [Ignavibacteriae bacterium]|nr:rRNA maturation RNase YbeY [Ignavibacteriota bacterium]